MSKLARPLKIGRNEGDEEIEIYEVGDMCTAWSKHAAARIAQLPILEQEIHHRRDQDRIFIELMKNRQAEMIGGI